MLTAQASERRTRTLEPQAIIAKGRGGVGIGCGSRFAYSFRCDHVGDPPVGGI